MRFSIGLIIRLEAILLDSIAERLTSAPEQARRGPGIEIRTFLRALNDRAIHFVESHAAVEREAEARPLRRSWEQTAFCVADAASGWRIRQYRRAARPARACPPQTRFLFLNSTAGQSKYVWQPSTQAGECRCWAVQ